MFERRIMDVHSSTKTTEATEATKATKATKATTATKQPRKSSSKLSKPVRARKIGSQGDWLSFPSISEAGRFFNLRPGHVSSAIRKNQRHAGYYHFEYDEPLEPENLQGEVWKPFLTAMVSNLGRVRSKTGVVSTPETFFHLQHQKFRIDRVIASVFDHEQSPHTPQTTQTTQTAQTAQTTQTTQY